MGKKTAKRWNVIEVEVTQCRNTLLQVKVSILNATGEEKHYYIYNSIISKVYLKVPEIEHKELHIDTTLSFNVITLLKYLSKCRLLGGFLLCCCVTAVVVHSFGYR